MPNKALSVGSPIESRCTKCRRVTNHIIVAMTAKGPARVECNTCGGHHNYRPPHDSAASKPSERRVRPAKMTDRDEWQQLRPELERQTAVPYQMSGSFRVGTVIKHPAFGIGRVQSHLGPGKIAVLFADGVKKLRCA